MVPSSKLAPPIEQEIDTTVVAPASPRPVPPVEAENPGMRARDVTAWYNETRKAIEKVSLDISQRRKRM